MSKVTEYLQKFKPVAADWFSMRTDEVRKNLEFCQEFFRRDELQRAEWDDIQKLRCLFAFSAMGLAEAKALGRPNHPIEHYRTSLDYLANGEGEHVERIRKLLSDPEYKLRYFGSSAISEIAAYLWPDEFVLWNEKSKNAAKFLEVRTAFGRGDDDAESILNFSRVLEPVRHEYRQIVGEQSDLPLNLEVDGFLEWIYDTQMPEKTPRYWLISHHVLNDNNIQPWIERILEERRVFIHEHRTQPPWPWGEIQQGDRCLIARGVGNTKRLLACGVIASDAKQDENNQEVFFRDLDPFIGLGIENEEALAREYGLEFPLADFGGAQTPAIFELNREIDSHQTVIQFIDFQVKKGTAMKEAEVVQQFKQVILQGPPGTGKTFKAVDLAKELIGAKGIDGLAWEGLRFDLEEKTGQWALVVFHPSYNYEDFVRGIKVETQNGQVHYTTADKIFCEMAKKAQEDTAKPYVLIIDEINRANLPAVMGELLYALEYRGKPVILPYAGETLEVPDNLYVIGTMNTADRSIGYLDYAVRRRFAFIQCEPSEKQLEEYYKDEILRKAALAIFHGVSALFGPGGDGYLSQDFDTRDVGIGHTYFMAKTPQELFRKCIFQVQPLLREYIKDGVLRPVEGKILIKVQDKSIDLASRNAQQELIDALWQILPH